MGKLEEYIPLKYYEIGDKVIINGIITEVKHGDILAINRCPKCVRNNIDNTCLFVKCAACERSDFKCIYFEKVN